MRILAYVILWSILLLALLLVMAFLRAAWAQPTMGQQIVNARHAAATAYGALASQQQAELITPELRERLQRHAQRATLVTMRATTELIDGNGAAAAQSCLEAQLILNLLEDALPHMEE